MRNILLSLTLTLAACGGIAAPPEPEPCPTIPDAGAPETSPDASPAPLDAGAPETSLDAAPDAPCDAGPRYTITGTYGEKVYDRTTGITWYGRFLYGSAFVPAPDICEGLFGPSVPMRRATVAEAMTILVFRPDGQVQFDDPFVWSNAIASQAADGCINLPPFSVTAFNECQGDLINRLCVQQ